MQRHETCDLSVSDLGPHLLDKIIIVIIITTIIINFIYRCRFETLSVAL